VSTGVKRVVYTALFGGYEDLQEQPSARLADGTDYLCFTDRADVTSDTWTVVHVPPAFVDDPVRSARLVKIVGHERLAGYDEWLWVDNRVVLSVAPSQILSSWLDGGHSLAMPLHDHRRSIEDEFEVILRNGFDSPARVREQSWTYSRVGPDVMGDEPLWTAIIARRNTADVAGRMNAWLWDVLRFSRRDQLSVTRALAGFEGLNRIELPNVESDLHRWLSTEELPKDSSIRFWDRSGYRYTLPRHAWDRGVANRPVRYLRWRLSTVMHSAG
jgi:hypothetical protein